LRRVGIAAVIVVGLGILFVWKHEPEPESTLRRLAATLCSNNPAQLPGDVKGFIAKTGTLQQIDPSVVLRGREEMVEHAQEIGAEIAEIERTVVILGLPVAACIPSRAGEMLGEGGKLQIPVRPVAADPVKKQQQRPLPGHVEGDFRCAGDEDFPDIRHLICHPVAFPMETA